MSNLAQKLIAASTTSFIDSTHESEEALRPKLLYNDTHRGNTVLAHLEHELQNCDSFWFSVAFVTKSGLVILKDILRELEERQPQVKGRILTSDYLSFNEPGALRELLQFSNLEVRVFTEENFHTKGYMFGSGEKKTFIVGSSNLTQTALKANKEWNLKITSLEQGELILESNLEFEAMWDRATVLTEQWISEIYEPRYREQKKIRKTNKVERIRTYTLQPNMMQREATRALAKLREENQQKALLISATGTGKTYLSAFDARNFNPKKMLFLVHREQILKKAEDSFKDVLGNGINSGLLTGNYHNKDADYLFSTVQTMSKDDTLHSFAPEYFDYIIIDESHKAGADSYRKIIDYFKPKFMLGMTASPERTDGYDIYKLFDNNIAYEIRLQKAMEADLLCPFHYFGVTELKVDGAVIDDNTEFRNLVSSERVDNIIEKAEFYGYSGDRVRGLIFCGTNKEAKELSAEFNRRGYDTVALSGANSQEEREEAVDRLEQDELQGKLDYIFTVDIFNEGIDIPKVNQIIMIRPTQSPIVFVQQLGRGLRKAEGKEYLVVIDFIGNYQNNFLIPIALSGDKSYNKDNLRKYVMEGSRVLPGCSTIHFDAIAREKIFASIDEIKGMKKIIRESYRNLKFKLGKIPSLIDFYVNGEVDPLVILKEYKTYYNFLKIEEEAYRTVEFEENEIIILEYLSKIVARGSRPHEVEILKELLNEKIFNVDELEIKLRDVYNLSDNMEDINSAISVLQGNFVTNDKEKQKYSKIDLLIKDRTSIYKVMASFYEKQKRVEFRKHVKDLVELGLRRYQDIYNSDSERRGKFVLYRKYSRRDVCLLLNWGKDLSSTMYGMKRVGEDVAIFVTYNKKVSSDDREYLEGKPDYADEFLAGSNQIFLWDSQIGKGPDSSYMKDLCEPERKHLFIKKSDAEGTDFYYVGQFEVIEVKAGQKKDNNGKMKEISKVRLKLHDPVREDLRDYLEFN